MADLMQFPKTWEEFETRYGFTDSEEIYTNGARLIPSFRVEQWLEHTKQKHGKWMKSGGDSYCLYKCTACNDLRTEAGWANCIPVERMYKVYKYCPNCGASMEMSEDEAD